MRKHYIVTVALILLLAGAAWADRGSGHGGNRGSGHEGNRENEREFRAELRGSQEVPPVETRTTGSIRVEFNEGLTKLTFRLRLRNGERITQAHFHCAPAGVNGPVMAFLMGNVPAGFDISEGEVEGFTLTDANIIATADCAATIGFDIRTIEDLFHAMSNGLIYANAHSVAHPGGVIRGQLEKD